MHKHAYSNGLGSRETRNTGRVRIIHWLCRNQGITPYVAPIVPSIAADYSVIGVRVVRPSGAVSHPEAILRTSDPTLQLLIDEEAERKDL